MAFQVRSEAMIIMVRPGRARTYNIGLWRDWSKGIPIYEIEPDALESTLKTLQWKKVTDVWVADSAYIPMPTKFRVLLKRTIKATAPYSIFQAGRPTFTPMFYSAKFTAEHDTHDKYGGLRYLQVEVALRHYEHMQYDQALAGSPIEYLDIVACQLAFPYSAFQLSSGEPNDIVTRNFEQLRRWFPSVIPHHSDLDILHSHKALAQLSESNMFLVFDSDLILEQGIDLEQFGAWDEAYVHVWYVRNPINGLIYGHGGPKAFNRASFTDLEAETVDVTTSANRMKMVVHPECVGIHAFNWSAESTWRTAFRESAKLTWQTVGERADEARERLDVWLNPDLADRGIDFWAECLDGAHAGRAWALEVPDNDDRVKVNNFQWLGEQFLIYEEAVKQVWAEQSLEADDGDLES